jgi:exopolyphosphatase / guanosine-5'-triphosphate,3'-diphosphate pyrophosphatase
MKVAALDLGTNTFLCLIAEVDKGRISRVIDDKVEIVRLGQDVSKTKKFHPEALERAKKCLTEFSENIKKHKPERVLAMATSAARDVSNAKDLIQLGKAVGIPIEIIPGNKEAEISYRGSISGFPADQKTRLVIDVGGGSTEFILGQRKLVLFSESVNIGCVRLTEKFISHQPIDKAELEQLKKHIFNAVQAVEEKTSKIAPLDEILAVAGTPTELARIEIGAFDTKRIDGYRFTAQRLNDWVRKFSQRNPKQIETDFSVSLGRADLILVGSLILHAACEIFKKKELVVSTRGVRFGVALELAERKT